MRHELKCDSGPFQDIAAGFKTFELRVDDRGYFEGDELLLRETEYTGAEMKRGRPLKYTGRTLLVRVSHIMRPSSDRTVIQGLNQGWVLMSIHKDKFPETHA